MPKLHDSCQILAEELLAALAPFTGEQRQQAFSVAWQTIVTALGNRTVDGAQIVSDLTMVMLYVLDTSARQDPVPSLPTLPIPFPIAPKYHPLQAHCIELVQDLFPQ